MHDDSVDNSVVVIFLEEAEELIEELDKVVHDWEDGADSLSSNIRIQQLLHTFKGGARLVGLSEAGNTAHEFESYLTIPVPKRLL